jgi:uncharacterized protein involved in outer membrane biogenesis
VGPETAMAIRRKTALTLILIAAAVLVTLIVLVPVLFDLDRYRPEVISYLQEKTGKPVEIGRLALTLFPSLSIRVDDFGLRNPVGFPSGYFVKARRIDATLDARALLHRQVVIKSVKLKDAVINLISDPDEGWNFENSTPSSTSEKVLPEGSHTSFGGVISEVEIEGGQLVASYLLPSDEPGVTIFEAHNVSGKLEHLDLGAFMDPSSSSLAAQGDLKADSVRFVSIQGTNVRSKLRLMAKQVFFADGSMTAYGGRGAGDLSFNLAGRNASFSANAQMDGVDVAHLLAAFPQGRGKLTGKLVGTMKFAGEIEHSHDPLSGIHGTGRVTVRNGQAPSLKLNANVMRLAHFNNLGPAAQNPDSFSSISADLEVAHQRISSRQINIVGYGVNAQCSGSLNVAGAGSLDYRGVAEILAKQGFFTNTMAKLAGATSKNRKLSFPFRASGTIDNPKFSVAH